MIRWGLAPLLVACSITVGQPEPSTPEPLPSQSSPAPVAAPVDEPRPPTPAPLSEDERFRLAIDHETEKLASVEKKTELDAKCAEKRQREEAEREAREHELAGAEQAAAWAEANCKLFQPPVREITKCEPVCIKETIVPCPEYQCRAKPPKPGWDKTSCERIGRDPSRRAMTIDQVLEKHNDPCSQQ